MRKTPLSSTSGSVPRGSAQTLPHTTTSCTPGNSTSDLEDLGDITDGDVVQHRTGEVLSSGEDDTKAYMSIMWHGSVLGMAYYDIDTTEIWMMMDTKETDDFQILKKVLVQVQPSSIVTSCKQDERLLKLLKQKGGVTDSDEDNEDNDFVQMLPSIDFALEVCKRRILSLNLPSIPDHFTESERTLYMSSLVPFECQNMVRATGALIKFLEKRRVGIELEESSIRVPVLGLKTFTLDNVMLLDENTYSALQIFQYESHPSVYKQGGWSSGGKEGLSLYGIVNRCKSVIGSRMLRLWFLRPLRDQKILKQRQDAVEFFCNVRNVEATNTLHDCLKNIKNVPRILSRMTKAQASIGDWQALYKTAYNAIHIGDICRTQTQDIDIFKKIGRVFTEELHRIATIISKIVDFEESTAQNRFVVKPNVDPELDEKKRTYNGLPDFMTKVAKQELDNLNESVTECKVLYLPQVGYLLTIPKADLEGTEDYQQIPGLEFMFVSNNMIHYKSARTRELDNLLGDTQCEITDHETSIMHRLQNTILEHSQVLLDVMDYAAQLDCLLALALCARENNYVKPELTTENVIQVRGGRHPLQELCVSPFVPNDILSGDKYSKIKILTGPNASGKSVYLKQVALIVFLAHIGSYVPAESAVIGAVDRIFTRVKTMESISVGLSTFMIDLNQVACALRCATDRSLVLLDEFGKGTETVDGLSLLCACLKHWLTNGNDCPHVFVSTHFHSMISQNLLPKSPLLEYQTMEVLQDGSDLVFLYQLIAGHTNSSHACHIASLAGLPPEIISRGKEVSGLLRQNKPVTRVDTATSEIQYRRCSTIVNKFLNLELDHDDVQGFLKNVVLPTSRGIAASSNSAKNNSK